MMSKHELVNVIAAADAAINAENFDALFDDLSRQREELDSLVETTSSSLLHLESVDRQLGILRVHTRSDGWRQNIARRCTSTGSGGTGSTPATPRSKTLDLHLRGQRPASLEANSKWLAALGHKQISANWASDGLVQPSRCRFPE